MKKVNKAVAFCRTATSQQIDDIDNSLDLQLDTIYKAAESRNTTVVEYWEAVGSGEAEVKEMFEYCKANPDVNYLFVTTPDRISRSLRQNRYLQAEFAGIGVEINAITISPEDKFKEALMLAMANFNSNLRSERVKRGLRQKALLKATDKA